MGAFLMKATPSVTWYHHPETKSERQREGRRTAHTEHFCGRTIGLPTNVLHLGGEVASYPGPNRLHAEDAVEALSEALPAVKASAGQS